MLSEPVPVQNLPIRPIELLSKYKPNSSIVNKITCEYLNMIECKEKDKNSGFNKQLSHIINGISTEFVYHTFDNKWMLLITQLGKLPALYSVTYDVQRNNRLIPYLHGPVDDPERHVSVPVTIKCIMGLDSDQVRGAIQFLVNKTALNECPTELVIGLGLKEVKTTDLRSIAEVLQELVFSK